MDEGCAFSISSLLYETESRTTLGDYLYWDVYSFFGAELSAAPLEFHYIFLDSKK